MLKLIVSKNESSLLQTMRSVRFGEMFSVDIPDDLYKVPEELTPSEAEMIEFVGAATRILTSCASSRGTDLRQRSTSR